ncbi:GTPase [Comamonas serinivorans]|uniref:GTPase n=1 Tax=Comamonas serinivorans TaxID=1082851 RepID=A0A1Y0ET57_9BURK|nr:DUF533 domain-containing protein [Comamonas serinivorans]ARU06590.1 GTPase [Comamonas serinivorans]
MSTSDTQNILRIALLAAFVDGDKHARERDAIRDIAQGLGASTGVNLPLLYQDVMLGRVDLAQASRELSSAEARQLAYEMAVCVCDADGSSSAAEHAFLQQLAQQLGLGSAAAQAFEDQATGLSAAATPAVPAATAAVPLVAAAAASTAAPATPQASVDRAALERQIRNAAITNGALELLPETLSTMAIIPLQMRLVYAIGKAHGYELDSSHIKDFLATLGVGLTSQYLEQAGRKLLGGLLRKVGGGAIGGVLGGVGKQAISSGMSFATTYALGHVALQYYAGGRQLSTQMLKDAYQNVLGQGQQLQTQYLPDMREKAKTINLNEVMALVRGQKAA